MSECAQRECKYVLVFLIALIGSPCPLTATTLQLPIPGGNGFIAHLFMLLQDSFTL